MANVQSTIDGPSSGAFEIALQRFEIFCAGVAEGQTERAPPKPRTSIAMFLRMIFAVGARRNTAWLPAHLRHDVGLDEVSKPVSWHHYLR